MGKQEISGAEMVIRAFQDHGVNCIFGYPGGAVLPLYDALHQQDGIQHILVRHEQGALHAAKGYASSSGKVGVAVVTSGPGATNAVTGLADAYLDSIPMVCISGQVSTPLLGTDAFQECDTVGITRHCTKHNFLVTQIEDLPRILHEAFYIASHGRPGPVVVDLPKDIQFAKGLYTPPEAGNCCPNYRPQLEPKREQLQQAVQLMTDAKRPVFYTGGGVARSGLSAEKALRNLVRRTGFPITSTLMGLGAFEGEDKQFLGMLGMHGTYEANLAMHNADVIIAVGARFDDRVTAKLDEFAPSAKIIHIDIDPSSINKIVHVDVPLLGDCGFVLEAMDTLWREEDYHADPKTLAAWWTQIAQWRAMDCLAFEKSKHALKPQNVLQRLYERTKSQEVYVSTDVGLHQMWTAQYWKFKDASHFLTSGGLGTMGVGLPAAIGAQCAHPDALVITVTGDGSIQMNIQELMTAAQYNLPVKVLLLNNGVLGMVRQWQKFFHGKRYSQSHPDKQPDFVKLAEAFGGKGLRITSPDDLDAALETMLNTDGFFVLDCVVSKDENCFPMIPVGNAHNDMLLHPLTKQSKPQTPAHSLLSADSEAI